MIVNFKIDQQEITKALKAYIITVHPEFKDREFKPTRKTPVLGFDIYPSNKEYENAINRTGK